MPTFFMFFDPMLFWIQSYCESTFLFVDMKTHTDIYHYILTDLHQMLQHDKHLLIVQSYLPIAL